MPCLPLDPYEVYKSALAPALSQAGPVWLLVSWHWVMYHQQRVGAMRHILAFAPPKCVPLYTV